MFGNGRRRAAVQVRYEDSTDDKGTLRGSTRLAQRAEARGERQAEEGTATEQDMGRRAGVLAVFQRAVVEEEYTRDRPGRR